MKRQKINILWSFGYVYMFIAQHTVLKFRWGDSLNETKPSINQLIIVQRSKQTQARQLSFSKKVKTPYNKTYLSPSQQSTCISAL